MIGEVDVFLSDIVLGGLCFMLGFLLFRKSNSWARVFIALGIATFFGAFYHGFINTTTVLWGDLLWTSTLFWFAFTSFLMIDESYGRKPLIRFGLVVVLVAYMVWAIFVSEAFLWALILQGVAIIVLSLRYVCMFRAQQAKQKRKLLDALLIGFLVVNISAIVLQQLKVNFGLPISHNTVFHIIELPAMILLFYFLRGLSGIRK